MTEDSNHAISNSFLLDDDSRLVSTILSLILLETTTLYNGAILSALSISSLCFAFGFSKSPHTNCEIPHRLGRRTKHSL